MLIIKADHLDHLDHLDHPDHPYRLDHPDLKMDHLDHLDHPNKPDLTSLTTLNRRWSTWTTWTIWTTLTNRTTLSSLTDERFINEIIRELALFTWSSFCFLLMGLRVRCDTIKWLFQAFLSLLYLTIMILNENMLNPKKIGTSIPGTVLISRGPESQQNQLCFQISFRF